MIYVSFAHCQKDHKSQHEAALSLFTNMLTFLGLPETEILKEDSGRPFVNVDDLDLSISHSGNCAAVAVITSRFAEDCEDILCFPVNGTRIGLDIEEEKDGADLDNMKKISRRFLSAEIDSADDFYRLWTRNESYGKMTGEGVISRSNHQCLQQTSYLYLDDRKIWLSFSVK